MIHAKNRRKAFQQQEFEQVAWQEKGNSITDILRIKQMEVIGSDTDTAHPAKGMSWFQLGQS